MKIIITEGGSAENVGSMALIENAIKIARIKFPNSDITVLSLNPKSVANALKIDNIEKVKVLEDLFVHPVEKSKFVKLVWFFKTLIWIIIVRGLQFCHISPLIVSTKNKRILFNEIKDASYIFCIGAERINDVYYKTVFLSLEALSIYQRLGKKLVHFSLTIGPLFYQPSIKKARKVLNKSFAIFVRDQKSFEWLDTLNVTKPKIYNSFDIAILQEKKVDAENLLTEFNLKPNFIGVSFIEWAFRKVDGPIRMEEYAKSVAETLDYIIEEYKLQIVFTPTVVSSILNKIDDVAASQKVIDLMKNKDKVIIINRLLTPVEMATIFSEAKYSIVTRMHAAILCSGAGGKPIIAINYLYKLREYMKNIQLEKLSIDIDYVNSKELICYTNDIENHYDKTLFDLNIRMNICKNILLSDIDNCFNQK